MIYPLVKIQDICTTSSGGTPSRQVSEYYVGTIPWIKSGDLKENIVTEATEFLSEDAIKNSSAKIVKKGAILLAMYGATIGRLAILGIDAATNQAVCNINPDQSRAFTKYIYYALLNKVPEFLNNAIGGAQPNISQSIIKDMLIPLPPLPIQRHIARVLDQADQLRKQAQQMETELNALAQAVFLEMFGDPVTNPKGWNLSTLRKISLRFSDGPFGSNLKSEHYTEEGTRIIRLQNIGIGTFIDKDKAYVSAEHAKKLSKFTCQGGDIVIATLGNPNLRACIIPYHIIKAINKADCIHCVPNQSLVLKDYLIYFLNSEAFVKSLENDLHGQTRTRINSGQLAEANILIPPLDRQQEFSKIIENINTRLTDIRKNQVFLNNLFHSLVQKAFKGELIPTTIEDAA